MNFVPQTSIVDCEVSCDNMFHELIDFAKNTNGSCDPRFLIDGIGEICDFGGVTLSKIIRKRGGEIGDYSKRYQRPPLSVFDYGEISHCFDTGCQPSENWRYMFNQIC
ncbi:Uncharacterized protein Rs2_24143 [Raphanus sativus]|nr:Uncharacterized protein Rs2_24143 [Raphanus sativus]